MPRPVPRPVPEGVTPPWLAGFLCALLALVALLDWSDATEKLDRLVHDAWVRADARPPPADVVIVGIDPASLDELGRWPWPRDLQALAFDELGRLGARAVVVDLIYTEASPRHADDARLAAALEKLPVSVLPVVLEAGAGATVTERLPLPILSRSVTDLGHVALPIDGDGIVRRVFLRAGFNRPHWSSLALAAFERLEPGHRATGERSLPGRRSPPSDRHPGDWIEDHEVLLPFYGPAGTLPSVSAVDLLRDRVARDEIAGRVVFFGLTADGLGDIVPTPVSALDRPLSGIEVHATLFAALHDGSLVVAADPRLGYLVAILSLPILVLLYSRTPPQWSLPLALGAAALPLLLSASLYLRNDLWYPPVGVSLVMLASYLFWSRHRLAFVNRFLESERARFDGASPRGDSRENSRLASFFEHAALHLPIDGWRFDAAGERFSGGEPLPPESTGSQARGVWREHDGVHLKRYANPDKLLIELRIADPAFANDIVRYVDSLARVRSRSRPSRLSGPVERLQSNVRELGDQLAYLRGVKVFSETLLSGSPVGFVVWNPAGERVRDNDLVRALSPQLGERRSLIDFLRALGQDPAEPEARRRMKRLILHGEPWQFRHEAGEQALVIDLSGLGERLPERLVCATVVDVSAIRSVERSRAEMVDYLSHDLRSPLISALYSVENELAAPSDDGDGDAASGTAPDTVHRVGENIRRSLAMMDDLLHIVRADAIDVEASGELLFDAVVDNALDQLLPQARARRMRFHVRGVERDLWMRGDASSLERAVTNVLGNALKYSPEGSDVHVRLDVETVSAHPLAEQIVLVIGDSGIGIDPAMIDELFTRFRRDPRVMGRYPGMGLGLALVSRVVHLHGGDVSASSGSEGTEVTLRLPLANVWSGPGRRPADAPPALRA